MPQFFDSAGGSASWESSFQEKAVFDLVGEAGQPGTSKAWVDHSADYIDIFRDPQRNDSCTVVTQTAKATGSGTETFTFQRVDATRWVARSVGQAPLKRVTGSYKFASDPKACTQTFGTPIPDDVAPQLRPLQFELTVDPATRRAQGTHSVTDGPTQQYNGYAGHVQQLGGTLSWDLGYLPAECRRQTVTPERSLKTASTIAGQSDTFERDYQRLNQQSAVRILRSETSPIGLPAGVEGVTNGINPAVISPIYSRIESPFHLAAVIAHELNHAAWTTGHGFTIEDAAAVLTAEDWASLRREVEYQAREYAAKVVEEIAKQSGDLTPCRDRLILRSPELWGPQSERERRHEVAEAEDPTSVERLYDKAHADADPDPSTRAKIEQFVRDELPQIRQTWAPFAAP